MNGPPSWLEALGRWLLRRRLDAGAVDEISGDLAELWHSRRAAGRRRLRRAYVADVAGVLMRRRAGARPFSPRRRLRPIEGASSMWHDLRYSLRLVARQPMFAAVTVATLALGIAASTSIFTAVDRLLLRPLPYPDPEALFIVHETPFRSAVGRMDLDPRIGDLGVFDAAGLFAEGGLNIDGHGEPMRVAAAAASPGVFDALDVPPAMGRIYTREEDVEGANGVAVVSDGLWRRLGEDESILDRQLLINARPFRVVGVMPPGFTFPGHTDLWIPPFSDRQVTGQAFGPAVVARLSPGVGPEDAAAALDRLRLQRSRDAANVDLKPSRLVRLQDSLTERVRPLVLLLAAGVALLLIVTCSNVASLLLSRVAGRQNEFVLRRALGGSRWRLTRLLLTESLTLSLIAGAVGSGGAVLVLGTIPVLMDAPIAGVDLGTVDWRLLMTALSVAVVTGVVFGLAPGVAAAAQAPSQIVRANVAVTGSRFWSAFRSSLVVLQVAVAVVLVAVTAATVQTMVRLARVDLGFGNTQALALEVTLPQERYDSPARVIAFYRDAAERLRAVPGVRRVGATGVLPGDRALGVGLRVTPAALPADQADRIPFAIMLYASPDYFRAMGVRIVKGRAFTAADAAGAPPVMIVSESEAAAIWPDGRDPIGEIVTLGRATTFEVVGVVSDVRLRGPDTDAPVRQFYRSILQSPPFGPMVFVVDADTPPFALVPAMRAALADVDPDLPMYNVQPVAAITTGFLAAHRLAMTLMGGFAAMTLLLAAVGLYGVLAQIVSQRTREIGIRIALGAGTARLLRGVVLHGLGLAAAGIALGAAAAGIAARLIRAFVPSLDALAWTTIAADAMVLLVVALVATWIPARRAASVDPLVSLRAD